ncbi:hypothetical protein BDQ12DRAFT_334765 [Crucibulum laeve]|uniref:Uncharacterized protein n=1 Tax=Crucibulum laeve TaxID=68775 RepID=A0A5C3LQA2_9AGAR|nr:hypothetical protein BDQ12DRAFT_334765 [Crucibulum laeve]
MYNLSQEEKVDLSSEILAPLCTIRIIFGSRSAGSGCRHSNFDATSISYFCQSMMSRVATQKSDERPMVGVDGAFRCYTTDVCATHTDSRAIQRSVCVIVEWDQMEVECGVLVKFLISNWLTYGIPLLPLTTAPRSISIIPTTLSYIPIAHSLLYRGGSGKGGVRAGGAARPAEEDIRACTPNSGSEPKRESFLVFMPSPTSSLLTATFD